MEFIQDTLFGKTFPEPLAVTEEKILEPSLKNLLESKKRTPLCLRFHKLAGHMQIVSVETDGALHTEFLTRNIGESPSAAVESTLSQILEANVPKKYYLSAKACEGILRRAERRGKELPPMLKTALEQQSAQQNSFDSLSSNSMKSKNPHSGCRAVEIAKTLDTGYPDPSKNQGGIAIVEKIILDDQGGQQISVCTDGKSPTLRAEAHGNAPYVINKKTLVYDTRGNGAGETVPTITGDHNNRITDHTALCCEAVVYDGANITSPLNKTNPQAGDPCHTISTDSRNYIVRRLTPTECARLQGFPDWWGEIPKKDNLTDDEYVFWLNARNTYAKINNKTTKEYSKEQMLSWYNKLHSDSSEYKMWGNGIALPNALYVMQGIAEVVGVHHSK